MNIRQKSGQEFQQDAQPILSRLQQVYRHFLGGLLTAPAWLSRTGVHLYVIAVALTGLALLAQLGFNELLLPAAFPFFFAAVALSALWGGFRSGIVALALCAVAKICFILPPEYFLLFNVHLTSFIILGLLICWLGGAVSTSQRLLAAAFLSIGEGVVIADRKGRVISMNRMARALTGWSEWQVTGRKIEEILQFVDETTDTPVECPAERVIRTGEQVEMSDQLLLNSRTDTKILVDCCAAPIGDTPGSRSGVIVTFRDVSRRKWGMEKLRKSEERFRRLFNSNLLGIYVADTEGGISEANDTLLRMIGYTDEELRSGGLRWDRMTPPEWNAADDRALTQLREFGTTPPFEKEYIRKDGSRVPILIGGTFLDASHKAVLGFALDLTEHKRTEEALRRSEEWLRLAESAAGIGTWEWDVINDRYRRSEESFRLYGLSPGEGMVTHQQWLQRIHPDDRENFGLSTDLILHCRQTFSIDFRVLWPDGSVRWHRTQGRIVYNESGQAVRVYGAEIDITDRKTAEESVKRMNESLRQLSGRLLRLQDEERRRIARALHDGVGQNLVALAMNLSLMNTGQCTECQAAHKCNYLGDSVSLAEQCSREIRSISYLLHPPLLDELGLATALQSFIQGFQERTGISVEARGLSGLDRLPPPVETTLFRIVQEGLSNVRRHSGSDRASLRVERNGSEIQLQLRDYGRGIPAEILDDGIGESANLGVGILGMRERARQLGGLLDIHADGSGTVVTVTLPLETQ